MTELAPKYAHVVRAIFERPWAILPSTLALIVDIARFRAGGGSLSDDEVRERVRAASNGPRGGGSRGSGVAVIPIYGVLANRMQGLRTSGATTVDEIRADFRDALASEDVGSIVFDVDSPGGSVDGIEELAAEIRAARGQKPIAAVANTMAASAAYWLAAQADELVVTPSGQVGSIGVFAAHQDLSKAAETEGVKTTLISAGRFKVEGNQWEPLTDEARASIQGQVDEFYGMFVDAVAKGRGVSAATVRSDYGEGRMLLAKSAKAAGMADRVDTLENTIRRAGTGKIRSRVENGGAKAYVVDFPLQASVPLQFTSTEPGVLEARVAGDVTFAAALEHLAGPIPVHHGTTDDGAFDGPVIEASIPNSEGEATFRQMYAWNDPDGNPDAKAAYSFLHHFWRGAPGPASTRACSSGIGVCNGGRGGSPDATWWPDREGIHAHLAAHLRDAGLEAPGLMPMGGTDIVVPAGSGTGLPFAARLEVVATEMEELVAVAERHKAARVSEGRDLSAAAREQLGLVAHRIGALLAAAPAESSEDDRRVRARARLAVIEAAATAGYRLS